MVDSTLRLGIDARPAQRGAQQFSRSAEDISRKAERTTKATGRVESSFARLRREGGAVGGAFNRLSQQASGLASNLFSLKGAAAGVAGAAGLGYVVKQSLDAAANIEQLANRAGVSTKALQELTFAANKYGVSQDDIIDGLKELQIRADEFAATGKGQGADAFRRIGVTAQEAQRKIDGSGRGLEFVIAQIRDLDSSAAQARAFEELFGGQAGERIRQITGDLGQLRDRAQELGIVLDRDLIQNADEARDRFETLTSVLNKQFIAAVAQAAPQINNLLTDILEDLPEFISDVREAAEAIGLLDKAASNLGSGGDPLVSALNERREFLEEFKASADTVAQAFFNADSSGNLKQLNARLDELAKQGGKVSGVVQGIREDFGQTIDSSEEVDAALIDLNRTLGNASAEQNRLAQDSQLVANTMALVNDASRAAASGIDVSGTSAQDAADKVADLNVDYADLRRRMDAVNPAIEAHRRVLDGSANDANDAGRAITEFGRDTRDAADDVTDFEQIATGAMEGVGASAQREFAA